MPTKKRRRKSQQASKTTQCDSPPFDDNTPLDTDIKRDDRVSGDLEYAENDFTEDGYENMDYADANGEMEVANPSSAPKTVTGKYWAQRFRLFSKYNEGILLDDEGWYSVTPELIATHLAERIWRSLSKPVVARRPKKKRKLAITTQQAPSYDARMLMDAFCGPGGNSIQFAIAAPPGGIVFAIDIDPVKIEMARHNAAIYGVDSRIEFVIGDSLVLAPHFRADGVFLSPPWGGPQYLEEYEYSLKSLQPVPGDVMYSTFRAVSPNIAMLLPRNVSQAEVVALAEKGQAIEVEGNYLSGKLKTVTAYYGALVRSSEGEPAIDAHSTLNLEPLPPHIDSPIEDE